jgi:hypothetical protein
MLSVHLLLSRMEIKMNKPILFAVEGGIDLRPLWVAVQAANLAKVGGSKRADGKVLKTPGWVPPDIAGLLRQQGWESTP